MSAAAHMAIGDVPLPPFLAEPRFSLKEIAALWSLDRTKVRELFLNEAGVIRDGQTRILKSAVLRVHRKYTGSGWRASTALEQHFTPQELAKVDGCSAE